MIRGPLFLFALLLLGFPALAEDWPTWQHDAARTGRTSEKATVRQFPKSPAAAWKFGFPERVHFRMQPIVAGGVVYVGCMDRRLYALDASDGKLLWTTETDGEITNAPTVDHGVVVFGTIGGSVYGLKAEDGKVSWQVRTGGPVMSSPAVEDGRAFIASFDGGLYAFDVATGRQLWRLQTGNKIVQSPAAKDGRVFVGSEDLHAWCAEAATGRLLWKSEVGGITLRWGYPVVVAARGDPRVAARAGGTVAFTTVQPGRGFAGGYKGGHYEEKAIAEKDETKLFDAATGQRKFPDLRIACWYYNMIPPVAPDDHTLWLLDSHLHVLDLTTGRGEAGSNSRMPASCLTIGVHSTRHDERPCPSIGGDGLLYGVIDQDIFTYDVEKRKVDRNLWGSPYLHRKPPDPVPGDNLLRFSTGTGGGGAGCGCSFVMAGGMGYTIIYSRLYAFKLSEP